MDLPEKVIEIILYLLNETRNNRALGDIDVKVLEESGYTQTQISNAFSWLFDQLVAKGQLAPHLKARREYSRRILHDLEKRVLTQEAQGFLIQLRELGILDDEMVEAVIDRAMISGSPSIGLEETKILVSSLVFGKGELKKIGSRYFSRWSETIH